MRGKKLRVGIAGYGVVGKRRGGYIDQHPDLITVAVCDQNFREPGRLDDNIKCFPNYHQMLDEELDVLFISLPNYLAPEVTIAGLERGLHVFCEKPPGKDVSDIQRVMEAEGKNSSLVLKYGFNHRYHASVCEAMRIINSGELGEIINLRGVYGKSKLVPFIGEWRADRRFSGGGILLDQGIHMVDLIRLFCGEIREVKSFVSNRFWKFDVEDNAYALMRDEQGRIALLHSSATQWQHRFALEITLTEGYLELHGILSGTKSYGEEKLVVGRKTNSHTGSDRREIITYLQDNSWRDEIYEFADSILRGKKIVHGNSRDTLETMKLVYRIYWADPEWRTRFGIANPD